MHQPKPFLPRRTHPIPVSSIPFDFDFPFAVVIFEVAVDVEHGFSGVDMPMAGIATKGVTVAHKGAVFVEFDPAVPLGIVLGGHVGAGLEYLGHPPFARELFF